MILDTSLRLKLLISVNLLLDTNIFIEINVIALEHINNYYMQKDKMMGSIFYY